MLLMSLALVLCFKMLRLEIDMKLLQTDAMRKLTLNGQSKSLFLSPRLWELLNAD